MKKGILLILMLSFCAGLLAVKKPTLKTRIKEGYAAVKSQSGQDKAEKVLLDSLNSANQNDEELLSEAWFVCALLEQSQYDALNQKAYLKQQLDTLKLYGNILGAYRYILKCDSLDKHKKYASRCRELMKLDRPNLLGGGKFLLRKSKWLESWNFFDMYLKTRGEENDSLTGKVAYWATVASVKAAKDSLVLKHVDLAIEMGAERDRMNLAEYRARAYRGVGDSLNWKNCLEEGVKLYPAHEYFFLKLIDYYIHHDALQRAQVLTDSLLDVDNGKPVFWLAKSLIALDQKDYQTCIAMSDSCLSLDKDNADALYNKGVSYLNMALQQKMPDVRQMMYKGALHPFERLRELQPKAVNRWGAQLYRIYFHLNMGRKFDEVDALLKSSDT